MNSRIMGNKVYVSPTEIPNAQIEARRNRCYLMQNVLCLIGILTLAVLGGKCVYRSLTNDTINVDKALSWSVKMRNQLGDELVDVSEDLIGEFETFIRKHNKQYSSMKEHFERFAIFSKNIKEIRKSQEKANNTLFEASYFSDQTEEELKKMIMPYEEVPKLDIPKFDSSKIPLLKRPASFDWRSKGAVMGIKNQEQCGSCWAFATVAVVESLNIINKGNRITLSEQELLDCDRRSRGCSGGVRAYAFEFIKANGLVGDEIYKYEAKQDQCQLPSISKNQTRIFVSQVYGFNRDEEKMADWVASKGPITIGVNVTNEMFSYRSGVFNPTAYDCAYKSLGSHSMAVVGYGTLNGEDYWLLKNSWGPSHGESGYIRMKRGVNSCGIANNVYTGLINKIN